MKFFKVQKMNRVTGVIEMGRVRPGKKFREPNKSLIVQETKKSYNNLVYIEKGNQIFPNQRNKDVRCQKGRGIYSGSSELLSKSNKLIWTSSKSGKTDRIFRNQGLALCGSISISEKENYYLIQRKRVKRLQDLEANG